jgi:mannose-1-phosphate guanylyltransferase/phosphomannomutase
VRAEDLRLPAARWRVRLLERAVPAAHEEGHELYGAVVDGYWADIGSLAGYVQAHVDVLDGKVGCYIPGFRTKDDVWVGDGARIDSEADVSAKVVVGANCRVEAGARLSEYTVLGDNCVVSRDAHLHRSVLWNDAFVGERAVLHGTVVCRSVDVRANARVEVGSSIGDETSVGEGAVIGNDVQVDAGANFGLDSRTPGIELYAGVSKRF